MAKTDELKFVVGRNIHRLREKSGKTMTELCVSIGMSRAFWSDVEDGNKEASITTLERIAGALEVTVPDLLTPEPQTVFAQSEVSREKKTKRRKAS